MKLSEIPAYLMMWALAGTFTVVVYVFVEGKETITWDEYLGVAVLWPLFIIKYIALGLYFIFSAGFGALV